MFKKILENFSRIFLLWKQQKKQKNIFKNFKNKYNKNTLKYKKIIMKKIMILSLILAPNLVSANYLNSANFLSEKWIIVNQSQNPEKYNLEKNILRQEIAWIIAKMSNLEEKTTCENKFEDVKNTANNKWACGRIESLLEAGIIAANKNYNPESFVSKSEALWFILKWLYKEDYEKYIKNNENNSWEENAKNFAKEKWILEEEITNFTEKAKRGFIFFIMEKALKWKKLEEVNTPENKEKAEKFLNSKQWLYNTNSEIYHAAKETFWEKSDMLQIVMNLVNNWEFKYNYKTSSSEKWLWWNSSKTLWWRWNGITAEQISAINDATYVWSIVSSVDGLREQWAPDSLIKDHFKNKWWADTPSYKDLIYYMETGKTDFR